MIYIVDDYNINLFIFEEYLENYKVKTFKNGADCIKEVRILKPELILMDIKMPDLDGYDTSKIIKEIDRDIKIIGISACNQRDTVKKGILCGMEMLLIKPVMKNDLVEKIQSVLM
jgi:CheY-like chemotaxis protein